MPSERTNGTGTKSSRPSPIATVTPEKSTERPGRRHRPHDRAVDVLRRSELLAEAVDDEQRVVDREPEPDELDEVRDVADHRELVREQRRRCPSVAGDRARGEAKRHEHGEREAEHREEHRERDRQRDRLAAQQVVREHGLEVVLDRRLAGDVARGWPASARRRVVV